MRYSTGEEIMKCDRVLFHGNPAEIEFVIEKLLGVPALDWHFTENGPGVMVLEPKEFGRAFVVHVEEAEDLRFVSRG